MTDPHPRPADPEVDALIHAIRAGLSEPSYSAEMARARRIVSSFLTSHAAKFVPACDCPPGECPGHNSAAPPRAAQEWTSLPDDRGWWWRRVHYGSGPNDEPVRVNVMDGVAWGDCAGKWRKCSEHADYYGVKVEWLRLAPPGSEGRLREALDKVMEWIDNWSPSFTEDEEWPATEAKALAALSPEPGEKEGGPK